ncbi:MAG: adenylosuccinate synthetase [bacterium]|nr:adenylosuccinate synthetase [bacterium]
MPKKSKSNLRIIQENLFQHPQEGITQTIKKIYQENKIELGKPKGEKKIYPDISRENTYAIVGAMLGDEGKGRLVDNKIEELLSKKGIKNVAVIRFQGGNNAGHTLEKGDLRIALHLVPSGIFHEKAIGIMDRGMVIHPEDLQTEIEYIEKNTQSLEKRLFLSEDAILCTDLERAEEALNRIKKGDARGGTGRGVGPAYAHHYDRLGLKIYHLTSDKWETNLGEQYDRYKKEFSCFGINLFLCEVPDFRGFVKEKKAKLRTVGTKKEFLERLRIARDFLLKRKIITNIFNLHEKIYNDDSFAVLFEGSQAAGLDAWLGTRPDVTSSNTSVYGVREGTAFWLPFMIKERIGVFKIPYTSSVGARKMPTHINLPKDLSDLPKNATNDQKWAAYVRDQANEYGTTTGRPRDINFLDLPFLAYNARMSGIETLVGTHLDISKEEYFIKVCTHYKDQKGNYIPYQPGLGHQNGVIPNYVELPGWDGKKCQKAKKTSDLPINALKFLSFIQARTGFPIVTVTTGPKRENIINLN